MLILLIGFTTISFTEPESDNNPYASSLSVVVQDMGGQPMTLDDFCNMLQGQLEVLFSSPTSLPITNVFPTRAQSLTARE